MNPWSEPPASSQKVLPSAPPDRRRGWSRVVDGEVNLTDALQGFDLSVATPGGNGLHFAMDEDGSIEDGNKQDMFLDFLD